MTPCDSAAASFHVPVKSTAVLEEASALAEADEALSLVELDEALVLVLADSLEAYEALALADSLEAGAESEAAELAAEELPDPPHAASARHATAIHIAAVITSAFCFQPLFNFIPSSLSLWFPARWPVTTARVPEGSFL